MRICPVVTAPLRIKAASAGVANEYLGPILTRVDESTSKRLVCIAPSPVTSGNAAVVPCSVSDRCRLVAMTAAERCCLVAMSAAASSTTSSLSDVHPRVDPKAFLFASSAVSATTFAVHTRVCVCRTVYLPLCGAGGGVRVCWGLVGSGVVCGVAVGRAPGELSGTAISLLGEVLGNIDRILVVDC